MTRKQQRQTFTADVQNRYRFWFTEQSRYP
nr:hypothetical protein [Pantoea agglomerans]